MQDRFSEWTASLDGPAVHGFAITPNDGTNIAEITRALYVGTGGAVSLVLASGAEIVLSGVQGGTLLPLRVQRIKATGTTAAALVGLV